MKFKKIQSAALILPLAASLLATASAQAAMWPFGGKASAQSDKDPLNDQEIDKIREARNQPVERIKLYQEFLAQRISAIKEIGPNPKAEDRRNELRAKYEEFTRLADELQDNLDTFDQEHADIRKALKDLVPATEKWPEILKRATPDRTYDFSRKTAVEAAQSILESATKLNEEQKKYFAEHKDEAGKNGTGPS
jgi:hypothetical protein